MSESWRMSIAGPCGEVTYQKNPVDPVDYYTWCLQIMEGLDELFPERKNNYFAQEGRAKCQKALAKAKKNNKEKTTCPTQTKPTTPA